LTDSTPEDTPSLPYHYNTQILMHMSANDLFLMSFTTSQRLTLSEKSFCHGCYWVKKLTPCQVLRLISTNEAHALALRHSTLFAGSILTKDPSSRGSSSPSLKPIPFSVPSSPANPDISDELLASLRVGIIVHDSMFAGRVNNIATLLETNRQVRLIDGSRQPCPH